MILENSVVNDLLSHYIFVVFSLKVPVPHMELWIHQIIGWSDIWPGNPAFVYPVPVSSWPKDPDIWQNMQLHSCLQSQKLPSDEKR